MLKPMGCNIPKKYESRVIKLYTLCAQEEIKRNLARIQRGLIVLRDQNRMMGRYLAGEFDDLEYPGETMALMSDFAGIFAREWEQLPASMQRASVLDKLPDCPFEPEVRRKEMDERKWEILNENYR